MANKDHAMGFQLYQENNQARIECDVDVANVPIICKNDLISQEAEGVVIRSSANDGVIACGVVESIKDANGKEVNYLPTLTVGTLRVIPLINNTFIIQDDASATLTKAAIGATANHVDAAGNTTTGISKQELNASDIGTGLQMRILALVKAVDNEAGDNAQWEVYLGENYQQDTASI